MEIKPLGRNRLRIILTQKELQAYGLSYETLDCKSALSKLLFLSLLEQGCAQTDFSPESRVVVEVFPAQNGGCVIYFSDQSEGPVRWKVLRPLIGPAIYVFSDVDLLIESAVKLFRRCAHRIRKSTLYRMENNWHLAVYPIDSAQGLTLSILDEFAPRYGEGALLEAWLEEHTQVVVRDNAIDLLSAYFG